MLSSMWALGVTGTYLGDYFGILMDHIVTSFPFNFTDAPMYYGSTMSFLGTAILYGKPAGIFLTAEVLGVYLIALRFEEYVYLADPAMALPRRVSRVCGANSHSPFTAGIYAKRDREQKGQKKDR